MKIRGSFRYIELTLISQSTVFLPISSPPVLSSVIIGILISNHLKNNSKILVEIFCQFKKKLYFCTRFRKGSQFIKIDQKIFLKKDLVVSKKGCTFAPAFKTSERSERDWKFFLKKIWSIEKKVVPLHPQKWRVKKMRPRKIFEKRFGQLKKRLYLCTRKQSD